VSRGFRLQPEDPQQVAMNEGSGGLGAVSAGISEPIVLIVLIVVGLLVAFVGWKLLKLILAAIAG
jgi:hypothetical protein